MGRAGYCRGLLVRRNTGLLIADEGSGKAVGDS